MPLLGARTCLVNEEWRMSSNNVGEQLQAKVIPLIGQDGPLRWSARPIEWSAVWNFCEAVEDGNRS